MSMSMAVAVIMPVIVGMAADFHVAATQTASAFFAHKISKFSFPIFDRHSAKGFKVGRVTPCAPLLPDTSPARTE
jgi:methyl coenzyme M reductase beta subunit